ncbi:hypothetical protein [Bradyrhizobium sp. WYCCWR 12699]|uniref:hypothetical protein n=1 Tax=Bradyrhizobium sp. WYCCWR 12699 TaxID=3064203 RepID=UPI0028A498AE|nr:hypothetical protein [Bradyrhizobium sp. WYCCWR 12699]MDT4738418.1 hypothetical protein [Bradyrhizobium sp. WYCCWR 12699]
MVTRKKAPKLLLLPGARGSRPTPAAGRHKNVARRAVIAAPQASGSYQATANLRISVAEKSRHSVKRVLGLSLAVEGPCETVVLDTRNSWAGSYAFCHQRAQPPMARRRVKEDLRAADFMLSEHLARFLRRDFRAVVVGIIDRPANPDQVDDVPTSAISDHFQIDFSALGEMYPTCPGLSA